LNVMAGGVRPSRSPVLRAAFHRLLQ
jgi:hypothetical protein